MNRAEILAEIERYIGIEVSANFDGTLAGIEDAALRVIEFLEDIGFDADASATEAGR
jgi:hypothetical protein